MISDLAYTNRDFYAFNQVKSRPTYLLLGLTAINLHTKSLYHLVCTLINEADVYTKKKS